MGIFSITWDESLFWARLFSLFFSDDNLIRWINRSDIYNLLSSQVLYGMWGLRAPPCGNGNYIKKKHPSCLPLLISLNILKLLRFTSVLASSAHSVFSFQFVLVHFLSGFLHLCHLFRLYQHFFNFIFTEIGWNQSFTSFCHFNVLTWAHVLLVFSRGVHQSSAAELTLPLLVSAERLEPTRCTVTAVCSGCQTGWRAAIRSLVSPAAPAPAACRASCCSPRLLTTSSVWVSRRKAALAWKMHT